jgi:hypothetical protein
MCGIEKTEGTPLCRRDTRISHLLGPNEELNHLWRPNNEFFLEYISYKEFYLYIFSSSNILAKMTSHPTTRPTCQPRVGGGSTRGPHRRWWGHEG